MKQFFYKYSTHNDYLAYDKFANYNANGNTLDLVSYCDEENELHYDSSTGTNNSIVPIEYLSINSIINGSWKTNAFTVNFTDYKISKGMGFGFRAQISQLWKSSSGWYCIAGINPWDANQRFHMFTNPGSFYFGLDFANQGGGNMFRWQTSGIHTVEAKSISSTQIGVFYDGVQKSTKTIFNFSSSTRYFYWMATDGGIVGKLYGYWIYNASNEKILDVIPVRLGTVGYLYDNVSGKLFKNSGTGTFGLGPDL